MLHNGEVTVTEAKRMLRGYWWILPLAVVLCGASGFGVATVMPKRYTSQTTLLIDDSTLPNDYVKADNDLNRRLASMQSQIMSRASLQPIIDKLGLYAGERQRLRVEDLVQRLAAAITVKPLESTPGTQNQSLPGFNLSVNFNDPRIAQQICNEITSMLMQHNAREREQHAAQATSFLSEQLKSAKHKLDEQDANLAQFKRRYLGSLPEEQQANLNLLTGMNAQLEANVQALARAHQDKAFNESLLSQQQASLAMSRLGQNTENDESQLTGLQEQLMALRARYTPEHPDVVKLEAQLEELKKRIASASKAGRKGVGENVVAGPEPAQVQQLRAKLRQEELNIADLTKRQAQIQDQIRSLQARLEASPVVEQQLKEISRNYQTAFDFYNDLLRKRNQSAMASDLQHQEESAEFRILDPPSLPNKPSFPKRTHFAAGGAAAGLVLGFGIMYLIAAFDKSMHTASDVEMCLRLPVLAMVPKLAMSTSQDKNLRIISARIPD